MASAPTSAPAGISPGWQPVASPRSRRLQGLPVASVLAGAKAEREVLAGMLTVGPDLVATRPGQTLIGDKNCFGAAFEATMASAEIKLLRPARKGEPAPAPGSSSHCASSSSRSSFLVRKVTLDIQSAYLG